MNRLLAILALALATSANAATFVVDTTSDLVSDDCTSGACSLRGALTAANLTPAEDRIEFDIADTDPGYQPATEHWLILVGATALPTIEAPVVIDGYTQPGASANTNTPDDGGLNGTLKIEIRPSAAFDNQQNGLTVVGNNFSQPASTLRGLVISRFRSQIQLGGSSAHRIEGCYLGTNISGSAASLTGNSGLGFGVRVQGPGPYRIGGLLPAERNLIGGMFGAIVFQSGSDGIRIEGNLIGTNASGTAAIANTQDGINSQSPIRNARIGGASSDARNIISASHFSALRLFSESATAFSGTLIEGNYFGTDISGRRALGNGLNPTSPSQTQPTIQIGGLNCALVFGGTAPGQANLIAYGGGAGIVNDQCPSISTPLNRFYGNRGIPFDNVFGGGAVGATPNDADDADNVGGNRLQNFPEITLPNGFLPSGDSSVALQYRIDTAIANASYPITVHFYRGTCGGGSDALIASDTYGAADAQQLRNFTLTSTDGTNVLPLVATAVDAAGNTSEFTAMVGDEVFRSDIEDALTPSTTGVCR